jgi:hypothetical protein
VSFFTGFCFLWYRRYYQLTATRFNVILIKDYSLIKLQKRCMVINKIILMKRIFVKTILIVFLFISFSDVINAQRFCIRVRPAAPAIVRSAYRPGGSIWIDGDWVWGGAGIGYQWHPGYWTTPPRPRAVWVPGLWLRERRGYYWRRGYWK